MRILVHGAGAVGGYFGALLARGGHDVTLVARGPHLAALQASGLTVKRPEGTLHVSPIRAVGEPTAAPGPEIVLVCVKSYDTPAAAQALRAVVGPDTIVLSLQNGIENEALLTEGLGLPPLLVGLTRIGVELTAPAEVTYSGRGEVIFGEGDGTPSARAARLAAAFAAASVPYELRHDVLVAAWEKLAWNAAFNAISTLTQSTVAETLAMSASRALVVQAMEEVDAVAIALGIPVRRTRTSAVLDESAGGLPDFPTSMLQDLRRGRRLEHDALNGAVVRAAARAGVPVPVNRALFALLSRLDPAARSAGPRQP